MSELGKNLIQGLNECLEYEQGKRHDLRTFTEVVYCKDCKYWYNEEYQDGYCCESDSMHWDADDFCSRGEKGEIK